MPKKIMTLKEHDLLYHHGNYRGGRCIFRQELAKGDVTEEALKVANEIETAQMTAREDERNRIRSLLEDNVGILKNKANRKSNTVSMSIGDQDDNGDVQVVVTTSPDTPDDAITEDVVKKVASGAGKKVDYSSVSFNDPKKLERFIYEREGLGYKVKDFKVSTLKGNNVPQGGRKVFAFKLHKDSRVDQVSPAALARLNRRPAAKAEAPMTDVQKSLALKQYGLKVDETGKVVPRAGREDETPAERYLRMVSQGETIPKNNAEIKKMREDKAAEAKKERDAFFEELGLMGEDFFKKLG